MDRYLNSKFCQGTFFNEIRTTQQSGKSKYITPRCDGLDGSCAILSIHWISMMLKNPKLSPSERISIIKNNARATMIMQSKIINTCFDLGWEFDQPPSLVYDHKEYTLRSVDYLKIPLIKHYYNLPEYIYYVNSNHEQIISMVERETHFGFLLSGTSLMHDEEGAVEGISHMVAVYSGIHAVYFFDPNFGEFVFEKSKFRMFYQRKILEMLGWESINSLRFWKIKSKFFEHRIPVINEDA